MARQTQRIYLCEGETEQHLVRALVRAKQIQPGKAQRFNAAQMEARKMVRKWGFEAELVVIIDGDTGPYDDNSRLARNLMTLKRHIGTPGLIIQCMNLEDELTRCCRLTRPQLYQAFDAVSASEFKQRFLQLSTEQVIARLERLGFTSRMLWQQSCRSSALKGSLTDWRRPQI